MLGHSELRTPADMEPSDEMGEGCQHGCSPALCWPSYPTSLTLSLFIQNTGHLAHNRRTERSNTWHSPDTVRSVCSSASPGRELTASAAATARIPTASAAPRGLSL